MSQTQKTRILFSIEAADPWIFQAYKGFFDSLTENDRYEVFCTACGASRDDELLKTYNVVDYKRISRQGPHLLVDDIGSAISPHLIKQARESSSWNSPEQILQHFHLFKVVFSLLQPDTVIVWNGMADIRRMVRLLLSDLHVPFFYAEKGMLPESWYIDEAGINARCSLDASSCGHIIEHFEKSKIEGYIQNIVSSGSSAWQQPSRAPGIQSIRAKLGIDDVARVIFFPGQVDEDVNITVFSPFRDVAEAVKLVLQSMSDAQVLVVKPHPKAQPKSCEQLRQLQADHENLIIVKDANVWDLIEIADLVVTINSTVGFEALLRKTKVLLLGESVLSKVELLSRVEQADLKARLYAYLSAPFESIIDYSRLLSFVKFLKDDYYIFRDSARLPVAVEQQLSRRAKAASPKIFTADALMSVFYGSTSQPQLVHNAPTPTTKATAVSTSSTLKLSVVLTTYNRPKFLDRTLAGFANQTVPREDFEVIVVDDGSQPPVKEIVEKFGDQINVVYLHQENSGLASARNNGVRAAKGRIVLFSDDDDMPAPELIAEHLRSHQQNPDERIAVLGHLDWHKDLKVTPLMHYITHEGGEYLGYDRLQDGQFYDVWKWWGGLVSAKLSLLRTVDGPFDSRLRFGYEDTELACRLLPTNIRVLYNAKAKSFALRPLDFETFCKRRYMQGQALHHVASVHPHIIIPRYQLRDAANIYYSRYAPYLEKWARKVKRFETMLNERVTRQGQDCDKLLQSVYKVYREFFMGYWLKGYLDQMQAAQTSRASLPEPAITQVKAPGAPPPAHAQSIVPADSPEPEASLTVDLSAQEPLRLAFVSTNVPLFDKGSSDVRNSQILKILTQNGVKVDYLYSLQTEDDARYKAEFGRAVTFITAPATINGFREYLHFNQVKQLDYVWITNLWSPNFMQSAAGLTRWLKSNRPHTSVIIDTMDFHYKKFRRKFDISHDGKDLLRANKFLEVEKTLYPLADIVLAVTDIEKRDILDNISPDCNVNVIPNIHQIPADATGLQQRKHICFLGSFLVRHNADAVNWFLTNTFPLIIRDAPQVEFHIFGFANEQYRRQFQAHPNVKIIGYVQDAESAVSNYRVFVCPMLYGAGMKGKLGTAAVAGTPIVTTTVGAEGFDFVDGRNCFIADQPEDFARKCLHLLKDDSLWEQFSIRAKQMVSENCSIQAVSRRIKALLQSPPTTKPAREPAIAPAAEPTPPAHRPQVAPSKPEVSVITSCYNCERFLPESLDSIRNQTVQQWELFLLDDGSTDGTRNIIEQYARTDARIKPYHFDENKGPYVRRNFAIRQANSPFIVINDSDDIMSPAKLEILHDRIISDDSLTVVGSFYRTFVDEFKALQYTEPQQLPLEHRDIAARLPLWQHVISHGSAIIRKTLFEAIGLYDENPFASDTFWFAKLGEYVRHCTNVKFANVPEYLTLVRIRPDGQTGLLPVLDPRNKRARYHMYCECKLEKIRQKLQTSLAVDVKTELKNCVCSDFLDRFRSHIIEWENQPLDSGFIPYLLDNSVRLFNKSYYVTCISMLRGIELMQPEVAARFRNCDLLRAMALLAIDMKQQCLTYLNREIKNHSNPAASKFISDYFQRNSKTDVQKWCSENCDRYDLQMIDMQVAHQVRLTK